MTNSNRAEIERIENEVRYRALFERTNDAIFLIGLDGIIVDVNQQAAMLLACRIDELIGIHISAHIKQSELKQAEIQFDQLLQVGALPLYERTFIRKDGREIPGEVNAALVYGIEGQPRYIQSIVRDITSRKRTEDELRRRIEQQQILRQVDEEFNSSLSISHVLMVALDAGMRLSSAKTGFIALTQDEEVRVATYVGRFGRDITNELITPDRGIIGRVLVNQESELVTDVRKDPDYAPLLADTIAEMVFPIASHEHFIGLLCLQTHQTNKFTQDNFEFVKLVVNRMAVAIDNARLYQEVHVQLQKMQDLYEQLSGLERLKTDMIRIASHDLRNPLGVLWGYLTIFDMDKDKFDVAYHEYLDTMRRAAKRMQNILNDILSLERIEQMAKDTGGKPFNLAELVKKAIEEFAPQAQQKAQAFVANVPERRRIIASGDESQIYEAITNLMSNAIKYTPDGGQIAVNLWIEEGKAIYQVQDTGYGIPDEMQKNLFQPFYRAKTDETLKIEGTGLGLHLVKNIIERHQGQMIFQSVYGMGSTFGFQLPLSSL